MPKDSGRRIGVQQWKYDYRESGGVRERETELWLYPEIDCSSCVDDVYDEPGTAQLQYYVRYIVERYPQWWEADAVPIYWSLEPVKETAPFQEERWQRLLEYHPEFARDENFLSFFTWPEHPVTGKPLDWYRLPVVNDRFPEFAKALDWTPSPLQPFCPLRSIMESRAGNSPRERRWVEANPHLRPQKRTVRGRKAVRQFTGKHGEEPS